MLAPIKNNDQTLKHNLTKFDLVKSHIFQHDYDIFGISETWLDQNDSDDNNYTDGYSKPIRRDNNHHQGGVLVYLSNSVPAKHRSDLEPLNSEIIAIELQLQHEKVLICNCYRPPHKDVIDFCADIEAVIENATPEFKSFIFLGDTNGRSSHFWSQDKTTTEGRAIKAMFDSLLFDQLINQPTHIMGDSKSCIDHIFINNNNIVSEVGVRPQIASDHCVVHATLKHKIIKAHSYKRMVWDYKRGDYEAFRQLILHAPWYLCYHSNDINVVVENFMNMFTSIADTCIPHYEATIWPNDKDFMNSDIRHKMNARDRYWKQYQQTNSDESHDRFKEMRNKVVYAIRQSKYNIEN